MSDPHPRWRSKPVHQYSDDAYCDFADKLDEWTAVASSNADEPAALFRDARHASMFARRLNMIEMMEGENGSDCG